MIEGKQLQIENRKRKYGQGKYNSGAQQKPCFTPRTGGPFQHTHGEEVYIIIMAPRIVMGMGIATARTVPTRQPQPRETRAKSLALSVRRPDIMLMNVLKPRMEMAMEALGRSRTLSTGDR